ncbi:hypothetical protein COU00_02580 [Candidatus Falkowbacteria bacterium CG10_big_fil_rev_8_21_14_0_10_43_11]|uniref:Uncharacterized protein n=1 Tax=Candidatus Falkowbacteria bacterium CG10_big_fil_rev_8_21_14_0_10_43_11 TaxID=1974568 RepID=A0A2M6WLW8_9BACT|nr:MAG: hypothetical protein COU00_02580 [Candidatus Falkowbacteria bacterium CG10_big_fil_rev_8_21_14_0_10_43_11]
MGLEKQFKSNSKILSDISLDIGQIFFAAMFVGPIITGGANWFTFIGGLVVSLIFWYLAILFNNLKKYGGYY